MNRLLMTFLLAVHFRRWTQLEHTQSFYLLVECFVVPPQFLIKFVLTYLSGSIPGMGRGGGTTAISRLDRRPKALLVAGFAPEEKDEVLLHLGAISQIQSHDFDVDVTGKSKLVVSFFDRAAAELVATQVCIPTGVFVVAKSNSVRGFVRP